MPGASRPSRRACASASGHARRRGVAERRDRVDDPLGVELEALGERREDPRVGLVVDEEVDVGERDGRGVARLARRLREAADRLLEGLVPVHREQLRLAVGDDQPGVRAVRAEHDRAERAGGAGASATIGAGAVAEERRRVAVGRVDVAGHDLRADHERSARRRPRASIPRAAASAARKPVHALPTSNAPAAWAPIACATCGAALGMIESWLQLATSTRSICSPADAGVGERRARGLRRQLGERIAPRRA